MAIVETPSPDWDERALPVTMIVLYASEMASVHYRIAADGRTTRLFGEDKRALHAGAAHWRGVTDIDSAAIAIELAGRNQGVVPHPYPDHQIDAVVRLVSEIKDRHQISRGNVVGGSDIAPARRRDPGELFPWSRLARLRLAMPRPTQNLIDPNWSEGGFLLALERFGYDVSEPMAAIMAFQRRYRPEMVDGEIDAECRCMLLALLLPKPQGDE